MDAAKRLAPDETEPLPWAEICRRYPKQYVCLGDIDRAELRSPEIKTARVVGHGPTRSAAFDPIRDLSAKYPRHAVRFMGVCTEPLIRPSLDVDDETLEPIRS
jgi:hypothetical protein